MPHVFISGQSAGGPEDLLALERTGQLGGLIERALTSSCDCASSGGRLPPVPPTAGDPKSILRAATSGDTDSGADDEMLSSESDGRMSAADFIAAHLSISCLVVFGQSWCPYCVRANEVLQKTIDTMILPPGLAPPQLSLHSVTLDSLLTSDRDVAKVQVRR